MMLPEVSGLSARVLTSQLVGKASPLATPVEISNALSVKLGGKHHLPTLRMAARQLGATTRTRFARRCFRAILGAGRGRVCEEWCQQP